MDDTLLIIAAVVAVLAIPIGAVGLSEGRAYRRQRADATRRKDKFRL